MCNTIYCDLHKKIYLKSDYENHLKTHKKCEICGNEFKTKKELRFHINMTHLDDKKSSNNNLELFKQNLNKYIDRDKIKCTECERTFGSAEAMSAHYYDIHERKRIEKDDKFKNNYKENKKEFLFKEIKEKEILENKKKEELER